MRALTRALAESRRARVAWLAWVVFGLAVVLIVVVEHEKRSVTPNYRDAAHAWWAGRDLYTQGIHGFLYLPVSAVLYTPFAGLPGIWGGVAWRVAGMALLAAAVWRLSQLTGGPIGTRFLLMTALVLPALAGSARSGQMNTPMAALLAHAAVDLAGAAWWRAAAALALAVALKPTALPMALLAAALFPATAWRIAVLGLGLAALPFATAAPGYAWAQHVEFLAKMKVAGNPPPERWQDLTGLIRATGYEPPLAWMAALRALAGAGTLAAGWLARRRLGAVGSAVLVYALGVTYVLLWNPRTEGMTYTVLAPAVAVLAAWALEDDARSVVGWFCVAVALVLGFGHFATGGPNTWLRPAATLGFLGCLLAWRRDPGRPWPRPVSGSGRGRAPGA